jgi:hypothetical protein
MIDRLLAAARLLLPASRERRRAVNVDDFELPSGKLSEGAQRVIDRALEDVHRREHALLTNTHVLFALAQSEWDLFAGTLRGAGVSEPARRDTRDGRAPAPSRAVRRHRPALRRSRDETGVQAGAAPGRPRGALHCEDRRPPARAVCRDGGYADIDSPAAPRRAADVNDVERDLNQAHARAVIANQIASK